MSNRKLVILLTLALLVLSTIIVVPARAQETLTKLGEIDIDQPQHVQIAGERAFVANATGVNVYNIRNPSRPVFIGVLDVPNASDMVVGEERLHVVNNQGLYVFALNYDMPTLLQSGTVQTGFLPFTEASLVEYPEQGGYNDMIWVTHGRGPTKLTVVNVHYNILQAGGTVDLDGQPEDILFADAFIYVAMGTHVSRLQMNMQGRVALHLPGSSLEVDPFHKFLFVGTHDGVVYPCYLPSLEVTGGNRVDEPVNTVLYRDGALAVVSSSKLTVLNAWQGPETWATLGVPAITDIDIYNNVALVAHNNVVDIYRWHWGNRAYMPAVSK